MTTTTQKNWFETYGGTAPENYERYFVPAIGAPLAFDLVALAELRPGERVVDVACGTGVVTRLAADRAGAAGTVAGVDLNPGMLAVARAVTPAAAPIEWHEANAETLPFSDASFDVGLCQLGLQFVPDRPAALRELHRVLAPGGRLLLNVPGPTPPVVAVLESALERHAGPQAAAFVQAVFALHEPAEVRDLLEGAGFADVVSRATEKTLPLPPPVDFLWQYLHSTPLAALLGELDDERREALERDVVSSSEPLLEDGELILRLPLTVATGRRPRR